MAEKKQNQNDLDRSINVGMDQFGRFVKLRWLWLLLVGGTLLLILLPN